MIAATSRYANSKVVTVENDITGKNVQAIVPSTPVSYTFNYTFYSFGSQDRVDILAQAFYGDPTKWWRFADANPEIMDWSVVTAGTQIRVPNI